MQWFERIFLKPTPPTAEQMIAYVLDKTADLGSRDDVAMDLSRFDDPVVEQTLINIALDHSEEEMIIDSAGNSLWEIWQRNHRPVPSDVVARMHPSAQKFFLTK